MSKSSLPDSLKVAVLMGGPSEEHAISLKSGAGVCGALGKAGFNVEAVTVPKALSMEDAAAWTERALRASGAEAVFIALHGPFGEDGRAQEVCEKLGLPYTGSGVEASRLGMDKWASRERFVKAGLRVPESLCLPAAKVTSAVVDRLPLPWVVKPRAQGSSIGIMRVSSVVEIAGAAAAAGKYGETIIIERFIRGRELTVGVLGDEPLPVVGIVPESGFFDYQAKYTPGKTRYEVPAAIDEKLSRALREMGKRAHAAVGCRHVSRTDFIVEGESAYVLEINTVPGLTETSLLPKAAACVGLDYTAVCRRLVEMAWHANRRELVHG